MGRKRRSRGERDVSTPYSIARPLLGLSRPLSFGVTPLVSRHSSISDDGRHFHPAPDFRPAFTLRGNKASVRLADRPASKRAISSGFNKRVRSQTKAFLTFAAPERVSVCVRRMRRKEVLFATKKAGRGGSQRKRRRNRNSVISCR